MNTPGSRAPASRADGLGGLARRLREGEKRDGSKLLVVTCTGAGRCRAGLPHPREGPRLRHRHGG